MNAHIVLAVVLSSFVAGCNCGPSGTKDAGTDAGRSDAGLPDAGSDAGVDAGEECDAGVATSSLTEMASRHLFTGTTTATTAGRFVVHGTSGQVLTGSVPTDESGQYEVEVPLFCGLQTIEFWWPGTCAEHLVVTVDRQQCTAADIQVTLTWDDRGLDFELHLIKPGGRINDNATDCTWTSCINGSPDWGVQGDATDNPHKDVDNTGHYGPENIYLHGPEQGVYWVLVEHWGTGQPANGEVTITLTGSNSVTIPITALTAHFVRSVARIDWGTRTVTPETLVTDCTANWSSGCRLMLP